MNRGAGTKPRHRRANDPSTNSASTRFARCRWTPCSRPNPAIRARRWPWRRWSTRCGSAFFALIRTIRLGRIAIASCCPTDTPRCCSIRCCISPASRRSTPSMVVPANSAVTLDDIKRFRQLDSKCPGHPEYHRDHGRRDDDRAPGSRLRDERRHGDRRALAGEAFQSARLRRCSTTTSMLFAATAT